MKKLIIFFNILLRVKLTFKTPKHCKLVLFDDESIIDLPNVLDGYEYFILPARHYKLKKIYFSPKVIAGFIKNYNGNIFTSYLVTILRIISPKVVLTWSHNLLKFHDVSRILKNDMEFLAIQNGAFYDFKKNKRSYEVGTSHFDINKRFHVPNLLCFGQFEIDEFKRFKVDVGKFYKVGSLRLENALNHISENKEKEFDLPSYDLCMISDAFISGMDERFKIPKMEEGIAKLTRYVINFSIKNNKKTVFALKRIDKKEREDEINFYKKYLTLEEFNYFSKNFLDRKNNRHQSYVVMLKSKVLIGTVTTMLRERLALGKKILACNFSPTDLWDFPIEGACTINNDCDYDTFEKKLLHVDSADDKNYFKDIATDKNYLMEFDKNIATSKKIKNIINSHLN